MPRAEWVVSEHQLRKQVLESVWHSSGVLALGNATVSSPRTWAGPVACLSMRAGASQVDVQSLYG